MKKPASSSKKKTSQVIETEKNKSEVEDLKKNASSLSYEESLEKIDSLLRKMQSNEIPVEELYEHYLRGKIYLEHCIDLLQVVESSISELDIDSLQ